MRGRIGVMAALAAVSAMAGQAPATAHPGSDIKGIPSAPVRLTKRRRGARRGKGRDPLPPGVRNNGKFARRMARHRWKPFRSVKGERTSPDLLTYLRWQAERTGGKHATRAWICAENGVRNSGRQWTRLRKRLAHEERLAIARARSSR